MRGLEKYRATFSNYTSNRAILATGRFTDATVEVSVSNRQPVPSPEEIEAAVSILSKDQEFGPAIRSGALQTYPAMPPLVDIDFADKQVERTLAVGLLCKAGKGINEVVGINMIRGSVIRYEGGAPITSDASPESNCGVTIAGQLTTSNGTAGEFQVVISRGAEEIGRFLCIRPSASSGNNKSGIELRDVSYADHRARCASDRTAPPSSLLSGLRET